MSEPSSAPPSASSEEDRATVAAAVGAHQQAYERLLTKYQGPLRRHVGKMVRDQGQVDDLVQEAFVKAFSNIESYNPAYAFSTWLYRITTNHTIDYIRKKKLPTFSIDKPVQTRDGQLQMELPDSTYRPDRAIVTDQRNEILSAAIAELPEKYHRVIVMRHQQEMTYEEIATELDLPLGTVKAHIFRARALLNKALRARRAELE